MNNLSISSLNSIFCVYSNQGKRFGLYQLPHLQNIFTFGHFEIVFDIMTEKALVKALYVRHYQFSR